MALNEFNYPTLTAHTVVEMQLFVDMRGPHGASSV